MMHRIVAAVVVAIGTSAASGFDARLATGLRVDIERIPESLTVDGVPITVHRASGADVPELARRIEAQWRSQGSPIRSLQQAPWTLRSRIHGARSEVLQWRRAATSHELLWSSLNATAPVRAALATGLDLPVGCTWGRSVSGKAGNRTFLQRSAHCNLSAGRLAAALRQSLPAQGWQLRTASGSGLIVDQAGNQGLLSLEGLEDGRATWVTWLRVEALR